MFTNTYEIKLVNSIFFPYFSTFKFLNSLIFIIMLNMPQVSYVVHYQARTVKMTNTESESWHANDLKIIS